MRMLSTRVAPCRVGGDAAALQEQLPVCIRPPWHTRMLMFNIWRWIFFAAHAQKEKKKSFLCVCNQGNSSLINVQYPWGKGKKKKREKENKQKLDPRSFHIALKANK